MFQTIGQWLNKKLNLVENDPWENAHPSECRLVKPPGRRAYGGLMAGLWRAYGGHNGIEDASQISPNATTNYLEEPEIEAPIPLTLEEQKTNHLAQIEYQIKRVSTDRQEHLEEADRLGLLVRNLLMERTKAFSMWNQKIADQSLNAAWKAGIFENEKK
jgi:hypothetical protein